MGSFVLLPASTGMTRGSFTVTGAASAHAAMSDSSDTSYINLSSPVTTYGDWGGSIFFPITPQALPFNARVKYMMAYARSATTGGSFRTFKTRIHDGRFTSLPWTTTIPYNLTTTITDYTGWGETFAPNTPAHLDPRIFTPVATSGDIITQSVLDKLQIEVYGFQDTDVRFYKMGVHVEYDEQPVTNLTYPASGGTVDSSTPVISWDYFDDQQGQAAYEVEIYSGSTLVYASGTRNVGTPFHQVEGEPLDNGIYKVRVRTAQFWTGAGGTFWSEWDEHLFVVAASTLTLPGITANSPANSGHVDLTVTPFFNLLSYNAVGSEDNTTGGHPDWYTSSNATVASSATSLARSGSTAHAMTLTGSTGIIISEHVPVAEGMEYYGSAHQRLITGSSANGRVSIRWFDDANNVISTSDGTPISVATGAYTQLTASGTAPSGATTAALLVSFAGVNGNVTLVDDAVITPILVANPSNATTIRGGVFEYAGRNLLDYITATMANEHTWLSAAASTTVTSESSPNRIGAAGSIKLKNTSGGAATISAQPGGTGNLNERSKHFAVTPGESIRVNGSFYSPVSSRTVQINAMWHDSTGVATTSNTVSGTSSVGAWTEVSGTVTVPAGASYCRIQVAALSTANNEEHYVDRVSASRAPLDNAGQWRQGYRTHNGPFVTIEWSEDDGDTWTHFHTSDVFSPTEAALEVADYELADDLPRLYRTYTWVTIDGNTYRSSIAELEAPFVLQLEHVWLHVKGDEANTIYNFRQPLPGRTESIGNDSYVNHYEGREYPLTEFGEFRSRTVQVQLQLLSDEELNAFRTLAERKALVVYRDQRGRRGIAQLASAQITDEQWGNTAMFTVTLSGEQP